MKYTAEVFQRLSRGQFISSNSTDPTTRAIYNDLEESTEEYESYFSQIDFLLCGGNGYFYFARNEQKVVIENKLRSFVDWIDYLDFLTTYDTSFDVGSQFTLAQMEVRADSDVELKQKLHALFDETKPSARDKLEALAAAMVSQGFAEEINQIEGKYQVTTAYRYLTGIVESLNIDEEVEDEIPE